MGIFALGVMPYISSSIIMTLMQSAIPFLKSLKNKDQKEEGNYLQYTRYAPFIAAVQGYGVSIGLESMQTTYGNIVFDPGYFLD